MASLRDEYIIEYVKLGGYVKVSAVDTATGKEACVIVPSYGISEKQMQELAIRKLKYVLQKGESKEN
jgi:4-hydroxy-3-methylbut-2-enyl diphosphate reductase IspH